MRKRVGRWENKGNLGRMEEPLRKLIIDLADGENDRMHLKRNTPVGRELTWQPRWSRRISIHIEIWEHRLGNVWNQHLTLKQLEYHKPKQNKGLAWKISQKQTYDRPHIVSCLCWKDILRDTRIPSYKLLKHSGYSIRCWGYRGIIISHPN